MPCAKGDIWQRAWMKSIEGLWNWSTPPVIDLHHGNGLGMLAQGSRDWTDYTFSTRITPRLSDTAGVAVRVQGLRRYYALRFDADGRARLVKRTGPAEIVLAETPHRLELDRTYDLTLSACGGELVATLDGALLFAAADPAPDALAGGAAAFLLTAGSIRVHTATITAMP
jgi:hypothetical protein